MAACPIWDSGSGARYKPKVDALAAELLARAPNPPAPTPHATVQKRAKDTMTEFAALFASIAAAYQPIEKDENGWPIQAAPSHRHHFNTNSARTPAASIIQFRACQTGSPLLQPRALCLLPEPR
jgi:hypothetical protein